ncbi:hypothetical protein ACEPAH_227 [Sanghuangporus vaninii]
MGRKAAAKVGKKNGATSNTNTNTNTNANADSDSAAVEILPYLFLGPRSAAACEPFVRAHGITHVLSIGASPPGGALPGVAYARVPMLDTPGARLEGVYERAREAIGAVRPVRPAERDEDDGEAPGDVDSQSSAPVQAKTKTKAKTKLKPNQSQKEKKILVHCSAAVSRSPSIVAAYLMSEHGMSLRESLGRIVRARPAVNPNPGLFAQLKEMEVRIRGCSSMEGVESLPGRKEERVRLFEHEEGARALEEKVRVVFYFLLSRIDDLRQFSWTSSNLLRRLNPRSQTDNLEADTTVYIPLGLYQHSHTSQRKDQENIPPDVCINELI